MIDSSLCANRRRGAVGGTRGGDVGDGDVLGEGDGAEGREDGEARVDGGPAVDEAHQQGVPRLSATRVSLEEGRPIHTGGRCSRTGCRSSWLSALPRIRTARRRSGLSIRYSFF